MQFVEAYLLQVSQHLPASERDDIVDELRGNIEGEIESLLERQSGYSQEQAELQVLQNLGHPLKVAAGYRANQYLIGPDLYPVYLQALKTLLTLVLSLQIVVVALVWFSNSTPWQVSFAGLFSQLFQTALWVTGIVTVIFVAIQFSGDKLGWYDNWQPEKLKLGATASISRSDLMINLITAIAFLLWWNEAILLPSAIDYGQDSLTVTLTEGWNTLFWPANAIVGASALLYLLVLARGYWQRQTVVAEIALNTAFIALALWLLSTGPLLQINGSGDIGALLGSGLQRAAKIAVLVIVGFTLWDTWLAWKRLEHSTPGASGSPHPVT